MKKWISTNKKPIVDEVCKKYADEFKSVMNDKGMITNIINQCQSLTLINDEFLGQAVAIDYDEVCFLVYLDKTKKILQVSRVNEGKRIANMFEFSNNEKIAELLSEYVATRD